MRATIWSVPTTAEMVARRAGGRRRYNQWRQLLATRRLAQIVQIIVRNNWTGREWGIRAKIARELGVSRATIARDMQFIELGMRDPSYAEEWRRFHRWWRRTHGENFGPHPGATFPQMDHAHARITRAAS